MSDWEFFYFTIGLVAGAGVFLFASWLRDRMWF